MMLDTKKLEIQLNDQHDHTTAFLQTILETIDQIVQENKDQGEDLARNTKAIKLMEVEIEELRKKIDKQGERVENAAEAGANSAVKESLPNAVNKGISSILEPTKKKLTAKKGKLGKLKFWR